MPLCMMSVGSRAIILTHKHFQQFQLLILINCACCKFYTRCALGDAKFLIRTETGLRNNNYIAFVFHFIVRIDGRSFAGRDKSLTREVASY